jgi:hypothetical protein
MGFAPRSGEVLPYSFTAPDVSSVGLNEEELQFVKAMAYDFWESLAANEHISAEFREYLERGNPIRL